MATFDFPGLVKIRQRLARIQNPDAEPLMLQWRQTIVEGNRRGVLSGRDGFDQPMPPLSYRGGAGKRTANRKVPDYGTTREAPIVGSGANLTTRQYQQLTGPRLAPRGEASRVVRNLYDETRYDGKRWEAVAGWHDVVSREGIEFLPYHFAKNRGRATFPRYDLRPIRPRDYQHCVNAFRAWAKLLLRVT